MFAHAFRKLPELLKDFTENTVPRWGVDPEMPARIVIKLAGATPRRAGPFDLRYLRGEARVGLHTQDCSLPRSDSSDEANSCGTRFASFACQPTRQAHHQGEAVTLP